MDVLEYIITMPTAGRLTVTAPRGMEAIDYDVAVMMLDMIRSQWSEWRNEANLKDAMEFSWLGDASTC